MVRVIGFEKPLNCVTRRMLTQQSSKGVVLSLGFCDRSLEVMNTELPRGMPNHQ